MDTTPDPHGQAAMMLCDGLILLLIEKGIIDKDRVADLIEGLVEVQQESAGVRERAEGSMTTTALLRAVGGSISASAGPNPAPP
jgi:hypothetical protein